MRTPLQVLNLYPAHDYTLRGLLESRTTAAPHRPLLTVGGVTRSWSEFAGMVGATARVLLAKGVTPGDRVAVMGANSENHLAMLYALARIGAIMVPVNPDFGVEETRYILHHAGVTGVVAAASLLKTAASAAAGLEPFPWFAGLDAAGSDTPSLYELMETASGLALPDIDDPDATCLIIYTSGTTGFPKGVMHSQRTYVLVSEASVQRVHLQENDTVLIVLPLFHVNALFYSAGGTVAAGASMVIAPKFSASRFWDLAANSGATQVNVIESVGLILQTRPRSEFRADHKIRVAYGVRENASKTFREEFQIPVLVTGFGMSEIPGALCSPMDGPGKPGNMGVPGRHPDPARPWSECRVVDENGQDVAPDTVGELIVRTPIVMQGYFRDPDQTAAAFRDGWFMTGDLVRRDPDGYYFYVSRKKDIIRRRGENIAAAELERVIGAHPDVQEVAAIAVPSELGEDEILVAVVVRPGRTPGPLEISEWCRARLAPVKVPRFVAFVDDFPRTATHKIAKNLMRQDASLLERAVDLEPLGSIR